MSSIFKELSHSCREWRIQRGLTVNEMSQLSGKPSSEIEAYEDGYEDSASILIYYVLCGYPLEWFLKDKGRGL